MDSRPCRVVAAAAAAVVVLHILYPSTQISPNGRASDRVGIPVVCANIRASQARPEFKVGAEVDKHPGKETAVALVGCVPFAGPLICGARACAKGDWSGVCVQIASLALDTLSGGMCRRAKTTAVQARELSVLFGWELATGKQLRLAKQAAHLATEKEMLTNAFNIFLCADVVAKAALLKEARDHDHGK